MSQKGGLNQESNLSLRRSLREYGLGIAGGLLFSIPMLYTNEIWDWGSTIGPMRLVIWLGVTLLLLLGYNRFAGLRRSASALEVMIDSIEEYGLALLISALLLWLLGRISTGMPFQEMMGKIVLESLLVAVGVSIGTAQLGILTSGESDAVDLLEIGQGLEGDPAAAFDFQDLGSTLVLSLCGAYLLATGVAAVNEVTEIGSQASLWKIISLALLSLLLAGLILFSSNLIRAARGAAMLSAYGLARGTLLTYAVALSTSAMLLWFYGRFAGESLAVMLSYIVVVGFPAVLGASAGRLILSR